MIVTYLRCLKLPDFLSIFGSPALEIIAWIIREDCVFAHYQPAIRGVSLSPLAGLKTSPDFVVNSAERLILSEGPRSSGAE
jgi:hypothetical protein